MNCPRCNTPIPHGDMRITEGDPDDAYVDIELICNECGTEYFGRLKQKDLIVE